MSTVKHPQHILAIDKTYLFDTLDAVDGINSIDFEKFFEGANKHLVIHRRAELEKDEDYLQVLPYVLVTRECDLCAPDNLKLLSYYRPVTGGEDKLHGYLSVGFGGHIDLNDVVCDENSVIQFKETVLTSMRRELSQELGVHLNALTGCVIAGYRFITDRSRPTERVHLGVVFIAVLPSGVEIRPEALEIDYAGELTVSELLSKEVRGEATMEIWTRLVANEIDSYGLAGISSVERLSSEPLIG